MASGSYNSREAVPSNTYACERVRACVCVWVGGLVAVCGYVCVRAHYKKTKAGGHRYYLLFCSNG